MPEPISDAIHYEAYLIAIREGREEPNPDDYSAAEQSVSSILQLISEGFPLLQVEQ